MLEILVAALCIGNFRCDQASKAYLVQNPVPRIWILKEEDRIHKHAAAVVGEQTIIGITTLAAAATQKTYQIRLTDHLSFGRTSNTSLARTYYANMLVIGYSF